MYGSRLSALSPARAQESHRDVAARIESSPDRRAIVVEGGRVVGILTLSDVRRAISRADLLGQAPGAYGSGTTRSTGGWISWGAPEPL
jgi:CBS domain